MVEHGLALTLGVPWTGRLGLLGLLVGLSAMAPAPRGTGRWWLGLAAAVIGLVAGVPALVAGHRYLSGTMDVVTSHIVETAPLWSHWPWHRLASEGGLVLVAGLLAWKNGHGPKSLAAGVALVAGAAVGLLQVKYAYLLAAAGAWAMVEATRALASRLQGRTQLAAGLAIAIIVSVGMVDLAESPSGVHPEDAAFAELARTLRDRTEPQPIDEPGARPAWTVALRPSLGSQALFMGRRAVTSLTFWGTPELLDQLQLSLRALLSRDEAEAEATLDRLSARYVLVDDLAPYLESAILAAGLDLATYLGHRDPRLVYQEGLWYRLWAEDGSGTDHKPMGLGRFRRVAEARWDGGAFKLFQRVEGASVEGSTSPGAEVVVLMELTDPDGATFHWRSATTAGPSGVFAVRVPYSTEASRVTAWATRAEMVCGDVAPAPISITERAVVTGAVVRADCPR